MYLLARTHWQLPDTERRKLKRQEQNQENILRVTDDVIEIMYNTCL